MNKDQELERITVQAVNELIEFKGSNLPSKIITFSFNRRFGLLNKAELQNFIDNALKEYKDLRRGYVVQVVSQTQIRIGHK